MFGDDREITIDGLDYTDTTAEQQIALCSNDHKCQADADEHDPGCPIEQRLKEEIGF